MGIATRAAREVSTMAGRVAACVTLTALFLISANLLSQTQPPAPPHAGNRIAAHDGGDIVVVENDARVTIVRRHVANVRTVFSPAEQWLVLLVDYATLAGAPDGGVDTMYSYTALSGTWPMEDRWEGAATIEEYAIAGEAGPTGTMGLVGPRGLVQVLGPRDQDLFRDPAAIAVLSFRGARAPQHPAARQRGAQCGASVAVRADDGE
jgi:hypothetical protein